MPAVDEAQQLAPARMPRSRGYKRHRKDACELCGWAPPAEYALEALDVDHIRPLALGGTHDPENLRTLCPNCHRLKTLAERHQYVTRPAEKRPRLPLTAWRRARGKAIRRASVWPPGMPPGRPLSREKKS